jgi:hypothetical protein
VLNDWTKHIKWPTKIRRSFPSGAPSISRRQIFGVNFCLDSIELEVVIFPVPEDVPQEWKKMNAPSLDLKLRFSETKLRQFNQQIVDACFKFDLSFEDGTFICRNERNEIFLSLDYVDVTAEITPNTKFA